MNVELESFRNEALSNQLEEALEQEKLNIELQESLKDADLTMKLFLKDNTIKVEKIENSTKTKDNPQKANSFTDIVMEKVDIKDEKKPWIKKAISFVSKVGEELFDNVVKEFLKKKFKWGYSVYNNAKKALIATKNKDYETAAQKGSDSVLHMFQQIPSDTKKIIQNTKNVAIQEAFALGKN